MSVAGIPILDNLYPVTMDLWPIEAKEFNKVWPFYENLKQGRFTTTKCKDCGHIAFPPRGVICPACYSENLEYVDLPKRGKVVVLSEEVKGVPLGYESPLIHAVIEFDGPVKRMISKIVNCPVGTLKRGDEVEFVVFDVPSMPIEKGRAGTIVAERVFYAFQPVNK